MLRQIAVALTVVSSIICLPARAAPPAAPSMSISTSGQTVTVGWTAAAGASSYVLYYAPYPNVDYIGSVGMGTATSLTVTLPPGAAYFVAIRARNADGESPYSNIGTVIIPSGNTTVLQAGDYWEFEWSDRSTSSSSSGTTSTENNGTFRVTLGAPQSLGGRIVFPIVVSGDASVGKPIWNYLAADGPVLLGTRDGVSYSTIFGGDAGGWKGTGFFAFFPPDRTGVASLGTFQGNYRTTSAWIVARSSSIGGCTFYPEVGETICEQDYSSYSEREYHKTGVGPIGYRFSSSALFQGGGFISTHSILRTAELVKSSKVADDGTYFAGPPWRSLPNLGRAPSFPDAGAYNGLVLAFGGNWATEAPPWVQAFDPNAGTWRASVSSGADVSTVLGVSGGYLYAVGRASSTASASVLRFDAALSRWQVIGTAPAFSNLRGGAALSNGDLVALDCPGLGRMTMYIYSPATGSWRTGASYSSTILRPAIAAVGTDVYVIGGYLSGTLFDNGITGTVRRYRALTNTWENLAAAMPTPRDDAVAVAIGSKVYVMGGWGQTIDVPKGRVVEIFDATSRTWVAGPTIPQPRSNFAATVLNGRIYIIGGTDSNNTWVSSGFVLSP